MCACTGRTREVVTSAQIQSQIASRLAEVQQESTVNALSNASSGWYLAEVPISEQQLANV